MTRTLTAIAASAILANCTAAEFNAISAGLSQGLAEAQYSSAYTGSYYHPNAFEAYSGWPSYYSYGEYVGYKQCTYTGSFYTCDSDGDGYADMYGNTDDGSYSSTYSRVNGRGEGFSWDSYCSCWERDRSLDGPRKDHHDHYRD